jgi:hypothetical protein
MKSLLRAPGGRIVPALAALALALLTGCGGGAGAYPVRGQLLYEDGQPIKELESFDVTFTSEQLGISAIGTIGPDGAFRLTTTRQNDGAPPGQYQVFISQPHPDPERRETRMPVVDLAYEDPLTTKLTATVEPKNNEFTFKLRRFKSSGK